MKKIARNVTSTKTNNDTFFPNLRSRARHAQRRARGTRDDARGARVYYPYFQMIGEADAARNFITKKNTSKKCLDDFAARVVDGNNTPASSRFSVGTRHVTNRVRPRLAPFVTRPRRCTPRPDRHVLCRRRICARARARRRRSPRVRTAHRAREIHHPVHAIHPRCHAIGTGVGVAAVRAIESPPRPAAVD